MRTMSTRPSATFLPAPVDAIVGIWKFGKPPFFNTVTHSTPGHLLHWVAQGHYTLTTNGRAYKVRAGDLVYYHESEEVKWTGEASRVVFYSVGFLAPQFEPLPVTQRVIRMDATTGKRFRQLHALWTGSHNRAFAVHAHLNLILDSLSRRVQNTSTPTLPEATAPWWRAETALRAKRLFRPSVAELATLAGIGRGALFRACRAATGTTPMGRIRKLRLEEACGLLEFSHMNISRIADYLGYPRVHEFSREFAASFGQSPRAYRRQMVFKPAPKQEIGP